MVRPEGIVFTSAVIAARLIHFQKSRAGVGMTRSVRGEVYLKRFKCSNRLVISFYILDIVVHTCTKVTLVRFSLHAGMCWL